MESLEMPMGQKINTTGWNSLSHTCGDLQDGFIEQCQPLDAPFFVPAGSSFYGYFSCGAMSSTVRITR